MAVEAETGGGLTYEQATTGACVRTSATRGDPTGAAGERGSVRTTVVACPPGVVPRFEDTPVDRLVTGGIELRSEVPLPPAPPCFSGSGDCVGG